MLRAKMKERNFCTFAMMGVSAQEKSTQIFDGKTVCGPRTKIIKNCSDIRIFRAPMRQVVRSDNLNLRNGTAEGSQGAVGVVLRSNMVHMFQPDAFVLVTQRIQMTKRMLAANLTKKLLNKSTGVVL
jgi:hypothetical protein